MYRFRRAFMEGVLIGTVAIAASSCIPGLLDVDVPEQFLWTAVLVASPEHPSLQGTAAAVSRDLVTEAGITAEGLDPGVYSWRVRLGNCDNPGEVFGSESLYPDLTVEEEGEESVFAQTSPFQGTMSPGQAFHVDLRPTGTEDLMACGDFALTDGPPES